MENVDPCLRRCLNGYRANVNVPSTCFRLEISRQKKGVFPCVILLLTTTQNRAALPAIDKKRDRSVASSSSQPCPSSFLQCPSNPERPPRKLSPCRSTISLWLIIVHHTLSLYPAHHTYPVRRLQALPPWPSQQRQRRSLSRVSCSTWTEPLLIRRPPSRSTGTRRILLPPFSA